MKTWIIENISDGGEIRQMRMGNDWTPAEKFLAEKAGKGWQVVAMLPNPTRPPDTESNSWALSDYAEETVEVGEESYITRQRAWVSAPFPVPSEVTPRQFQLAIESLHPGMLETIDTIVASQPMAVQINWNKALGVKRDDPTLEDMRQDPLIDKTPAEVDDIFRLAATL